MHVKICKYIDGVFLYFVVYVYKLIMIYISSYLE